MSSQGGELARVEINSQTGIVLSGFLWTVQVIALLPTACLSIDAEQFLKLVKEVGFRAEVGEVLTLGQSISHGIFHGHPLKAVVAVAFNDSRCDAFTREDVLEGTLHGAGAGT